MVTLYEKRDQSSPGDNGGKSRSLEVDQHAGQGKSEYFKESLQTEAYFFRLFLYQ